MERARKQDTVAFLCPGQGSQQVGMAFDLYQAYPMAREIFHQADQRLGFSLSNLCFKGPEQELNTDLNAQLAVYTVSCIVIDLLKAADVFPYTVSGYSSGFYAAAYAAGCFDFSYGLHLVRRAGEILLDEGRKVSGNMAVIFGLSPEQVESICHQVGGAEIAIKNTPRQTVIAGIAKSVKEVMELSLIEGALDAYLISVSSAYHSRFVAQASTRFLQEINEADLHDPQLPLMSYLSLDYVNNKKELKDIMAAQLRGTVLWTDLIKKMCDNNIKLLIETGPGTIISRTVRWIDRNLEVLNTSTKEHLLKVVERGRMS